jgi:hypothetical protein
MNRTCARIAMILPILFCHQRPSQLGVHAMRHWLQCITLLTAVVSDWQSVSFSAEPKRPKAREFVPTDQYTARTLEGWTVRVNKKLLAEERELGERALKLLELKLYEIRQVVPGKACEKLQKVPIWLGVDDGHAPCAEYHPSREWLASHGYNPDKAKAVEIGNASRFVTWIKDQPAMVLHELAHAYHDQVLSFDHAGIKAAFQAAVDGKKYEAILRINGRREKAYALTNDHEYFAETTEAFFGTNDFYPFVRAELKEHDPRMYKLLTEVWSK